MMREIASELAGIKDGGYKTTVTNLYQKFSFAYGFVLNFPKLAGEMPFAKTEVSTKTSEIRDEVKTELPRSQSELPKAQDKVGGSVWEGVLKEMEGSPMFQRRKDQGQKGSSKVPHEVTVEKREVVKPESSRGQSKSPTYQDKGISVKNSPRPEISYIDGLKQRLAERGKIE